MQAAGRGSGVGELLEESYQHLRWLDAELEQTKSRIQWLAG